MNQQNVVLIRRMRKPRSFWGRALYSWILIFIFIVFVSIMALAWLGR